MATKLIEATDITLTRGEGRTEDVGKSVSISRTYHPDLWQEADRVLNGWAQTAPKQGYHKVDFVIKYADGKTYTGTYDLKHWSQGFPNLEKHVYDFIRFAAGRWPGELTEEEYRNFLSSKHVQQMVPKYSRFLDRYEIGKFNIKSKTDDLKPWDLTPEQRHALSLLGKYEILQVHDDGDLTLRSGDTKYVLTTDGNIFVHHTPEEALKKILGESYITVIDRGDTSFNNGEVISPESFQKENKRMRGMGLKEATGWTGEEGEWPKGGNGGSEGSIELLAAVKHRVRDRVALGDLKVGEKFWSYNSDAEYVVTEPPREYPGWGLMAHYKEVGTGKPMRASAAAWVFRYPPHEWGRGVKIPHGLLQPEGAEAKLQYLSDSPEYLAQTVGLSGWRGQLDKEFNAAIARARGVHEQAAVSS